MQTEHIKVTGMHCGGCTSTVTRALQATSGVDDVKVSLPAGEAIVKYDERVTSPDQLKSVIKSAGYGVDAGSVAHEQPSKAGCCG